MFLNNLRSAAIAVLLLAYGGLSAFGQGVSGSIAGVVFDVGGAIIPGAKVTLTNEGTGFTREATTNQQGQYVAYSLPVGPYRITAEKLGFQKLLRTGVTLAAADALTVDLTLSIGDVQQTVEVTDSTPLLQAQSAMVSTLVSNDQIIEMPLQSRTFTSLLLLSPGATKGSSGNLTTSPYAMRGDSNISVNGSSAQNNSYFIDGMVNRNLWLRTLIMVPTVDSIQEMRVLTSNYSAEYGIAAGAITVVQTKSGTNRLRGSLYEFVRNDKFDANNFFNNRARVDRPALRRNEFGATLGGPIRKDRTFFFADYQGIRVRKPLGSISTIPTLSQRNMFATGDFSALSTTIYDPYSTVLGSNGARQRAAFAGNQIPISRLDPAARSVIGLLQHLPRRERRAILSLTPA